MGLVVFEKRIAHGGGIAHETHATGSRIVYVAALDQDAAVVVVHENGIAADLVELTITDVDILGAGEQKCTSPVDRPVRAQERFLAIHEGARRVPHGEALERDVFDRLLQRAGKFHQVPQADDFHFRLGQIGSLLGQEIQRGALAVVEPLTGSIEFLKDIFHHAKILVHAHLAIVLPTAFVGHIPFGILAGDEVVVAAPAGGVHGVDETTGRIRPLRSALPGKRIRRIALVGVGFFCGIEIRVAGHALGFAVDEKLVDLQTLRRRGLENAVAVGLPIQLEFRTTAQDGTAFVHGAVNDRKLRAARVRRGEHERFRQMVNPVADMNGDRFLAGHFFGGIASRCKRGEVCGLCAGIGVLAHRAHMEVERQSVPGHGEGREEAREKEWFFCHSVSGL